MTKVKKLFKAVGDVIFKGYRFVVYVLGVLLLIGIFASAYLGATNSDVELNIQTVLYPLNLHMHSLVNTMFISRSVEPDEVEDIALDISSDCEGGAEDIMDKRCVVNEIENYIDENINYTTIYEDFNPSTVLEDGETDCKGKAVLFSSLLERVKQERDGWEDIDVYMVFQPYHVCVMYTLDGSALEGGDGVGWYNCMDRDIVYSSKLDME